MTAPNQVGLVVGPAHTLRDDFHRDVALGELGLAEDLDAHRPLHGVALEGEGGLVDPPALRAAAEFGLGAAVAAGDQAESGLVRHREAPR